MKLNFTNILLLLCTIFLQSTLLFSQPNVDGNYCPGPGLTGDEYADAIVANFTPGNNSTCSFFKLQAVIDDSTPEEEYIKIGIEHGNSGQAYFRFFFNTDCDSSTGSQIEPQRGNSGASTSVGGAEYRIDVNGNGGNVKVFEFTGIDGGTGFGIWNDITPGNSEIQAGEGIIDTSADASCNGSSQFIEIGISLEPTLGDPCLNDGCGVVEMTAALSNAGISPNSEFCQSETFSIGVPTNTPPQADFVIEESCDPESGPPYLPIIKLTATGTMDADIVNGDELDYEWTFTSAGTGGGTFSNPSGMNVTDISDMDTDFYPDSEDTYTFTLAVTDSYDCEVSSNDAVSTHTIVVEEISEAECLVLPVEFLGISGSFTDKNSVLLEWSTATEINSDYFEVQRQAEGGSNFVSVGTVDAAGNSIVQKDYSFLDQTVFGNSAYYRLKQVDLDGSFEYSNVIEVRNDFTESKLSIFSNENEFLVNLETRTNKQLDCIEVYNLQGRLVQLAEVNRSITNQVYQHSLNTSGFSKGLYLISIVYADGDRVTKKAIKQ